MGSYTSACSEHASVNLDTYSELRLCNCSSNAGVHTLPRTTKDSPHPIMRTRVSCFLALMSLCSRNSRHHSFSTKETLQDTARMQFEQHKKNKKARRHVYAQAAARGGEWRSDSPSPPLRPPVKQPNQLRDVAQHSLRTRSGSGASHSTATSDSGDLPVPLRHHPSFSSLSTTSSPSQSSAQPSVTSFFSRHHTPQPPTANSNGTMHSPAPSQSSSLLPPVAPNGSYPALSPVAVRMRERDADAMEKYLSSRGGRQRSGSADTMSTDPKSQNGSLAYSSANGDANFVSAGPSANGDDITALANLNLTGSVAPRRRLRPSASASQLGGKAHPPTAFGVDATSHRSRSGTSPADLALQATGIVRPTPPPAPVTVPPSTSSSATLTPPPERALYSSPSPVPNVSPRPSMPRTMSSGRGQGEFTGPPSAYAQFPEPPTDTPRASRERERDSPPQAKTPTQASSRRLGFKLTKSSGGGIDSAANGHRRGGSATSVTPLSVVRGLL